MSKKKIFAIIIFIVFGLFMFSFANPIEIDNPYGQVEVDKTKLKDAIDRGTALIEKHGTGSDVLKELDEAVKDGKDVYDDESTQDEVDDATKRIEDAIKNLEDDIMNRANISLYPNTLAPSTFVNLITTVTIDDNQYIDSVKFVVGTNCYANGTNLVLDANNQAVTRVTANSTYTSCLFLTNGTVKQASQTIGNINAEVPDTEAPVISLNGKELIKIVLGKTTYEDELARVIDNVDPEREIAGELVGKVDEIGSYELRYNAKDSAGNEATEVVRTIKVLDPKGDEDNDGFTNEEEIDAKTDLDDPESHPETEAPTITLKGKNPYIMLQNRKYVEAGVEITLDVHDTITTIDDVVVKGSVDTTKVGVYTITYTITDRYGKTASVERTVKVLDPNGDEDNDGFTNEEEIEKPLEPINPDEPKGENNPLVETDPTDPEDDNSHPETYAPSITLNGEDLLCLEVHSEYIEKGVSIVLDPHDTITTIDDVVVTGSVDTDTLGEYILTYTITDRYGKTASVTRTIDVIDSQAPVINLNGNSTITLERESEYVELGASVTDNYDKDLVAIITGSVDTNTLGTYYIRYNATDSSGNKATEVVRTVIVVRSENDKKVASISAVLNPTTYDRGTNTYGDLTVTATDNDGTTHVLNTSEYTVTGWDSSLEVGNESASRKLTIVLNSDNTISTTVDYEIVRSESDKQLNRIEATLEKTEYKRGEEIETLKVIAYDNDGTSYDVTNEASHDFDSTTVGDKTLNVTYEGKSDTVDYKVVRNDEDKQIKELTAELEKDVYKRGEAMSNIVVTRIDNDGTRTILDSTQYTLTGFSTEVVGTFTVTVTHDNLTATDTYTVGDIEIDIKTPALTVSGKNAEPGQIVDYEISLSTDMPEVSLPTYTIEIGEGMVLESCPANATCNGNTITWTPTSVDEKLNYSAKVGNNVPAGSVIKTTVKENNKVVKEFDTNIEVTVEVSTSQTTATSLEVVLTLDVSGSMWECSKSSWFTCESTKIEDLISVTKQFVTDLNNKNTNGSTINLTIITFGRRKDNACFNNGTCYETLYTGGLTSTTLTGINNAIDTIDDNGENRGGTHLYGALNSALNIINNSTLNNKYLVVLGDGEPTDEDNYNVINNLKTTTANVFSIGFKVSSGSKAERVLKSVVNNNDSHYFSADNSSSLEESFNTIQESIDTQAVQTVNGNIEANALNAKSIEISHSGMTKVTITDLSEINLSNYNISIVEGKFVWNVSKYPGNTNYKMIVNY